MKWQHSISLALFLLNSCPHRQCCLFFLVGSRLLASSSSFVYSCFASFSNNSKVFLHFLFVFLWRKMDKKNKQTKGEKETEVLSEKKNEECDICLFITKI